MAKDFKGDVGFGDKGYGKYAGSPGYGSVGMGDKGYGSYASSPGYAADLGGTLPDLTAPAATLQPGATGSAAAEVSKCPPGAVGIGDKGYGDYAGSPGYGSVGMGNKGYGTYASSRGYAKLGMSYPNLSAPPAKLGTKK